MQFGGRRFNPFKVGFAKEFGEHEEDNESLDDS
jgi:hypothetical protein